MAKTQKNKIHLEGIIEYCSINGDGDKKTASIRFCTSDQMKKDNKIIHPNKQRHNIITTLKDERSLEIFNRIAFECRHGNGQAASIDGQIIYVNDERFILSSPEKIKLIQAVNFKQNNIIELQGTIKKTFFNDAYASIIIENSLSENRKTTIPVIISKKDNIEKWSEIAAKSLYNGDTVTVSGKLSSHNYTDKEGKQIDDYCFISPKSIQKVALKEQQTRPKGIILH